MDSPIDFTTLLDSREDPMAPAGAMITDAYRHGEGQQIRANRGFLHDRVRLARDAFLFASDCSQQPTDEHQQVVNDRDWIHVQFLLKGCIKEVISDQHVLDVPNGSCIITRYPQGTLIRRTVHAASRWQFACLLMTPRGLRQLLDTSLNELPESAAWMACDTPALLCVSTLTLDPCMVAAAHEILACTVRGSARRAYMRAKSIELLSAILHSYERPSRFDTQLKSARISKADLEALEHARSIMDRNPQASLTLSKLASRVGMSRTKLALGFRNVHGLTVQAYWRDARLRWAQQLLREESVRITDLALRAGYAENSSFTRAFTRRFGMPPRACRGVLKAD